MSKRLFFAVTLIAASITVAALVATSASTIWSLITLMLVAAFLTFLGWFVSPGWKLQKQRQQRQKSQLRTATDSGVDEHTLVRLLEYLRRGGIQNENIHVATRQHWIVILQVVALFVLGLMVFAIALWLSTVTYTVPATRTEPAREEGITFWWLLMAAGLVPIGWGVWRWLIWHNTYWLITDTLLVRARLQPRFFPFLGSFRNPLPAAKIHDVKEEAPFPGNILGWVMVRASTQLQKEEDRMYNTMPLMPKGANFAARLLSIVPAYRAKV